MIVVDASIAGPILLADEEPLPAEIIEMLIKGPLAAPGHWPLEIVNLLQSARRRQRMSAGDYAVAIEQAQALRVDVEVDAERHIWRGAAALALEQQLTIYDAAYLDQALRLGAALATLDSNLVKAGRRLNVTVITRP